MKEILNSKQNESENIFEQYLDSNGFQGKWVYEPSIPGKIKKPDYLLNWKGEKHFFEVKELRKKRSEPNKWPAHIDPYTSLRKKIDEARDKFKEYKEYSCSLVVYNIDDKQVRLDPRTVFAAMLGNAGIAMNFDPNRAEAILESAREVFLNGGKMVNNKSRQNTTISAIVILKEFLDNRDVEKALIEEMKKQGRKFTLPEKIDIRMKLYENHHVQSVPRVVVIENPFARIKLPKNLFNGLFDERWRIGNDEVEMNFMGSALKESEFLKNKS
jgi:hypothetical protein